jgi:putative SOS response-associated peptidase YedK
MGAQLRDSHDGAERAMRGAAQSDDYVLGGEAWPVWLGEEPADARQLKAVLAPFPAEAMTCWPVSPRVGNVKNYDPSLIEPIAAE